MTTRQFRKKVQRLRQFCDKYPITECVSDDTPSIIGCIKVYTPMVFTHLTPVRVIEVTNRCTIGALLHEF